MIRETPTTDRDVAVLVADAHATGTPLRIVGNGTWRTGGRPVFAQRELSMRALSGIVEYVPSDLVMTVRAGTTLEEIALATAQYGQWLSLDPVGRDTGTIGATVATASSGAMSLGAGTVRDLVLGLGLVSGTGTPLRVGGRVVKNVAGFDLVRLSTGAFGTLGVLTDISVRLHAKPAVDATFAIGIDADRDPLDVVQSLGLRALSFHALEVLDPATTVRISAGDDARWLIVARAVGNATRVAAQRAILTTLGRVEERSAELWTALRDEPASSVSLRVTQAPSRLVATLDRVMFALRAAQITSAQLRVSPHRGAIRLVIPDAMTMAIEPLRHLVSALRSNATHGSVLGEQLPNEIWPLLPSATTDSISQRIRDAFDPRRILNRGIFGEHTA